MRKAIFPDSKSLQPMPSPDIHANVSGNINSSIDGVMPSKELTSNISSEQNNIPEKPQNTPTNLWFHINLSMAVVFFIFLIVFIYKELNKKTNFHSL
jgi:hypothetical protein